MLIDMHAHTGGISKCCRVPAEEVIRSLAEVGIDGIILTNHYCRSYAEAREKAILAEISADGVEACADKASAVAPNAGAVRLAAEYIEEFRRTREIGQAFGIKVFFGIEVSLAQHGDTHVLVYGVGEDFLLSNPEIYSYPLDALRNKVHGAGGYIVHAHPLRVTKNGKNNLLDLDMFDGIELNCHLVGNGPLTDEILALADKHRLFLTCGGDYHADTARTKCGVYLPDEVGSTAEIIGYIDGAREVEYLLELTEGVREAVRLRGGRS